ncbi:MAG TPA: DUF6049 family protein [Euzebya sp.]|nr:DUF6049 family protein [Euzebya sp.]
MKWLLAVLLALLLALPLTASGPLSSGPAGAQTSDTTPIEVTLRQIQAVLAADDPDATVSAQLLLRAGEHMRQDLRLVTTVYTRAESRTALGQAAEGELPSVFSAQSSDLPAMAPGTARLVATQASRAELSLQEPDRAGAYPLQFQVFEGPDPVASVTTTLIVLPEDRPAPLPTSLVVRIVDPETPPMRADVAPPGLEALIQPESPVRAAADQFEGIVSQGRGAGITLVPSSRLLSDLSQLADGFSRPDGTDVSAAERVARRAGDTVAQVRALARRGDTEVLAVPYGPADLVAMVRGGLDEQALQLLQLGIDGTGDVLDATVRPEILVPPDGLDAPTLAALGPARAEAVLLDARYLAFADEDGMEPVRRLRTADGGEVRVLVPDADLSVDLSDPRGEGTATVIQHLLAETALQWMAPAGVPGPSSTGVLLAVDALQPLPPDVIAQATTAIARASWLRPMGLSQLARDVSPADRGVRLAYPPRAAASELEAAYIARLGQALDALVPLRAILGEDDPAPDSYAESLLAAAALGYRQPEYRAAGDARSEEVLMRLAQLTDAVAVLPSAPITLTAATGEVPVTLTNSGDVPVRVRIQLDSTRFDFPAGDSQELTLQPESAQQLGFLARARNPGGFAAITVTVQDVTDRVTLTQTRISVRSTAFPVVGVIAIVGGGLVLLVWGVRQSLRRRRPGRHERVSDLEAGVA